MKRIILVFVMISLFALFGFTGNYLYKLNKSFDIFAEIIERISNDYVLDIDPEKLVKYGINGMLNSLDPYTAYYDSEDQSQLEMFTDGTYTGIGITVSVIDSMLTVSDIKYNGPAHIAGFKVGDVIYSVDSVEVFHLQPEKLRKYINYEDGKEFNYKILRNSDTINFSLNQEKIEIDDISYSFVSQDSILYAKLDYFSRKTANEFRKIIKDNNNGNTLKGLIIDLRDNPGGLLHSSVEICETFLPANSVVVSTKGKSNEDEYRTNREPLLDSLPLVVIINGRSASASEILAGAVQDYDRGVIIGKKSFGKGLVQSIIGLQYDANLKITTSKYYTPSGRSIQKLTFADDYTGRVIEDTSRTEYYTKNNRKVIEENGIMPDTIINNEENSEYIRFLKSNNVIFKFVTDFSNKMKDPVARMKDTNMVFEEFRRYVKKSDINYNKKYLVSLDSLAGSMKTDGYKNEIIEALNYVRNNLDDNDILLSENKSALVDEIKIEVIRRNFTTEEKYMYYLSNDNYFKTAKDIILTNKYVDFLN